MSLNKVLITGASGGLGNSLALYFSKKGHDILLHGRNENKLKDTQEKILKNGAKAKYIVADLKKNEDINYLNQIALAQFRGDKFCFCLDP